MELISDHQRTLTPSSPSSSPTCFMVQADPRFFDP